MIPADGFRSLAPCDNPAAGALSSLLGSRVFSLGSYDAPPSSSHSKELGLSRWSVFHDVSVLFHVSFLILSTYAVVCLLVCLCCGPFYPPCLDHVDVSSPGTVRTRLHSSCLLHPRCVPSKPLRPSPFFGEYDQRDREGPDPGEMARSVHATERESTWYPRVDELYKGTRHVPPLSLYNWHRDSRFRRSDAETRICRV